MFTEFGRTATQEIIEPDDMISVRDMNQISLIGTPIIGLANQLYRKEIPNLTLFPARKAEKKKNAKKEEKKEEVKKSMAAGVIQKVEISSSNKDKLPSVS